MKYKLLISLTFTAVIFLILSYVVYSWMRPLSVNVPKGDLYDAGSVVYPHSVIYAFKLQNPNPYPIALAIPIIGCACTTASISAKNIAPYGSATVNVMVTPEDPGPISADVCARVAHDDKQIDIWLSITGRSLKPTIKGQK